MGYPRRPREVKLSDYVSPPSRTRRRGPRRRRGGVVEAQVRPPVAGSRREPREGDRRERDGLVVVVGRDQEHQEIPSDLPRGRRGAGRGPGPGSRPGPDRRKEIPVTARRLLSEFRPAAGDGPRPPAAVLTEGEARDLC